ncbi:sodium:calcium symporter [Pelagicoccus sp. SDUM812002]|uniref:sodium:calcium symporter n=1 Tax=Pelagicoccus sp. SDUM812002 TaxID=3041266 RepID=UPI00280E203D|nr:sodium:calcium symporter [Pelagicoccus sp. SDUM812002]MDQ8185390.1 sodium:calcium symporter [Pelagicoccus sp. SDUM812002]
MTSQAPKESWNSRLGIILAVAGSAVGLGNFLRFPGLAAQYGGGAFMIAYLVALCLIGLPICWAEWAIGRAGGQRGFNSCPGILGIITGKRKFRYLGVIGVIIPVVIYMYYVYIEAWCLGYALNFASGNMKFDTVDKATNFWMTFIGIAEDGAAVGFGWQQVGGFLLFVFALNFFLIYRGISKGIELFCRYAMPTLLVLAVIILIRVLTLGTPDYTHPGRSVSNGLGYMWNPTKMVLFEKTAEPSAGKETWTALPDGEVVGKTMIAAAKAKAADDPNLELRSLNMFNQLSNPQLWLAAAGQIFFSLSVGFGVIITYSSYLKKNDDVVLSGLAATSTNELCEVGLGGLITLPAGVAFLGVAGVAGMGTFDLGFRVLPMIFSEMWGGQFFGFAFFFLLFLAAVTSSLSMLQPGIAFLEEAMKINRKQSVAILGFVTAMGCAFVVYFSKDVKALDTIDFWINNLFMVTLALVEIIIFGWIIGTDEGFKLAHRGAAIRIPNFFKFVMKYVSPAFLIIIFGSWFYSQVLGFSFTDEGRNYSSYIVDLFIEPNKTAWYSVGLITLTAGFLLLLTAGGAFSKQSKPKKEEQ